jgi:hypothetical protein
VNQTVSEFQLVAGQPANISLSDGGNVTMEAMGAFTLFVRQAAILPETLERGMVVKSKVLALDLPSNVQLKFPVGISIKGSSKPSAERRRRVLLSHLAALGPKVSCIFRLCVLVFSHLYSPLPVFLLD